MCVNLSNRNRLPLIDVIFYSRQFLVGEKILASEAISCRRQQKHYRGYTVESTVWKLQLTSDMFCISTILLFKLGAAFELWSTTLTSPSTFTTEREFLQVNSIYLCSKLCEQAYSVTKCEKELKLGNDKCSVGQIDGTGPQLKDALTLEQVYVTQLRKNALTKSEENVWNLHANLAFICSSSLSDGQDINRRHKFQWGNFSKIDQLPDHYGKEEAANLELQGWDVNVRH